MSKIGSRLIVGGIPKVADATGRLALSAQDGDTCVQLDTDELYLYTGSAWIVVGGLTPSMVSDTATIDLAVTSGILTAAVIPGGVDHDQLLNFDANEHFTQAAISIPASQISDFDTEVSNNTDVAANTSARVTNGDSHDHSGGDGAQIDHTTLSNIGTNTHTQIDTHISDTTVHYTQVSISIPASQVSDFDTEVSNNTDVAANTSHRTSNGSDHSYLDQAVTQTSSPTFSAISTDTITEKTTDHGVDVETVTLKDGNVTIPGDLEVNGTTVTINTATLEVEDANITVNLNGNQLSADDTAGITVEMSDATDCTILYDKDTTSKFKCGESGSEIEIATISASQTLTNKTIDADNNSISNLEVDNLKAGVLDTDLSSVSGSDDTVPSAKATKAALDLKQADVITTRGDIVRGSSTGVAERLAIGTSGQVLTSDGTDVSWSTPFSSSSLIGEIKAYAATSAPTNHLICNGQTIGKVGSGADNESADYESLFDLLKASWGNVGTESFSGGDTVLLPDLRGMFLRGTGSHGSLTMANGSPFAGPSVGSSENDQMQGHKHDVFATNINLANIGTNRPIVSSSTSNSNQTSGTPITDGTNGSPRAGDETRPVNYGVNYIICYQ